MLGIANEHRPSLVPSAQQAQTRARPQVPHLSDGGNHGIHAPGFMAKIWAWCLAKGGAQ